MATIKGTFQNFSDARHAMELLSKKGFSKVYLDAADNFDVEFAREINPPGTSEGPNLSSLVLRGQGTNYNVDKGPLMASYPAVSGMDSPDAWDNAKASLVIYVEDSKLEDVKKILLEAGGAWG